VQKGQNHVPTPEFDRIHDYLHFWSERVPAREALVMDSYRLTYADLRAAVDTRAAALLAHGIEHGDRVAVLSPPRPEFFVSFLATVSIGAVYIGFNPKSADDEIAFQLNDARPKVLIHHGGPTYQQQSNRLASIAESPVQAMSGEELDTNGGAGSAGLKGRRDIVAGADPAAIVYTSGTTGRPKGAVLPHHGFTTTYRVQNDRWLSSEGERAPVVEPINHVAAIGDESFALLAGGGTVCYLEQFHAEQLLDLIAAEKITFWYTDPAVLGLCTRSSHWTRTDFSSLRRIVWSGGRAPRPLVEKLTELGVQLGTSWGMTETVGSITYTDDAADISTLASSIGRADPTFEAAVMNADGHLIDGAEAGELCIRHPHLMVGYFNRDDSTSATIDGDGWLHTGDIVERWPDGNLELVGRLSEMFKSGGENVYPREVEQVLEAHDWVDAAVVVPRPDDIWGEVGHAYIICTAAVPQPDLHGNPNQLIAALRDYLREHVARFKVPKSFEFVDFLPLLGSGKVDRRTLKAQASAATTTQ
jgi:acyl-CoA synthetase (AMP-forming)/AMP-acid ligase II